MPQPWLDFDPQGWTLKQYLLRLRVVLMHIECLMAHHLTSKYKQTFLKKKQTAMQNLHYDSENTI